QSRQPLQIPLSRLPTKLVSQPRHILLRQQRSPLLRRNRSPADHQRQENNRTAPHPPSSMECSGLAAAFTPQSAPPNPAKHYHPPHIHRGTAISGCSPV